MGRLSLLGLFAYLLQEITVLISHLKNNAFPQPLSEAEEAEALERLRQGDPKAREKLIVHNLRLVAHVVKKFDLKDEEYDELIQIGAFGLIKAIDTFQPEKGTKLATYASKVVENEILMYLRAKKKSRRDISLSEPVGVDKEGNEIALIDVLAADDVDVDEKVGQRIERERIRRYLHLLEDREQEILTRRFGLDGGPETTQREIARALNISRSYVSRIEKRALNKLYHAIARESRRGLAGSEERRDRETGERREDGPEGAP